jgi:tetratricopeptide (TPR) repeat protein
MKNTIKEIISPILILLALLSIYFGGIAPFARSRGYISGTNNLSQVRSVDDFENTFDPVLESFSIIGDEEIPRYIGSDIILEVINSPGQPETEMRRLASYIEPYLYEKDIRHYLIRAYIYNALWNQFGQQEKDFLEAEKYYRQALEKAPDLPPVLYGLFELYANAGRKEKVFEIGNVILGNWPDDSEVKRIMESI